MKKLAVLCCALLSVMGALAYSGDYGSSSLSNGLMGLTIFIWLVTIIVSIIILVRWWKMTTHVAQIHQQITRANPKLTYLVAIGEIEQAQKAALKLLVDILYPIYSDPYNKSKAETMNQEIQARLSKIQKLGLSVPEYVTTGEKFIDYINNLTGGKVPYQE